MSYIENTELDIILKKKINSRITTNVNTSYNILILFIGNLILQKSN